jgi:hypothetical protein
VPILYLSKVTGRAQRPLHRERYVVDGGGASLLPGAHDASQVFSITGCSRIAAMVGRVDSLPRRRTGGNAAEPPG